jgi:hypothetical protein
MLHQLDLLSADELEPHQLELALGAHVKRCQESTTLSMIDDA